MEWKISRLLFGKQENKGKCVNKVFNKNAGFFFCWPLVLAHSPLLVSSPLRHFGICMSFWPKQWDCPIAELPSALIHRIPMWLLCFAFDALQQFYSLVNQMPVQMCASEHFALDHIWELPYLMNANQINTCKRNSVWSSKTSLGHNRPHTPSKLSPFIHCMPVICVELQREDDFSLCEGAFCSSWNQELHNRIKQSLSYQWKELKLDILFRLVSFFFHLYIFLPFLVDQSSHNGEYKTRSRNRGKSWKQHEKRHLLL